MTKEQRWLARRFLVYKFLCNMWFIGSIWLYFYRIYVTDQQVGVLDGLAFAIGLLAEVPSGALADKFGRDKMVRLGKILAGSGLIMQALGSSFAVFVIGQSIVMIGISFVSGADEALFFSRLKFKQESTDWRKLVTRTTQIGLAGTLIATIVGGALHDVNIRLPWILTGASFIASAIAVWGVKDTRKLAERKSFRREVADYGSDIKTGFVSFRLPQLWIYVPLIVIVQGLFYAYGYGLLRMVLLDRFGFSPFWGSVVIAGSTVSTIALLSLMYKHAHRISEKFVLTTITLSAAIAMLAGIPEIGYYGAAVIIALYTAEHVLQPFMSETINYHAPEKQRATVLSVASFLKTLPYVVLAPIIGYVNNVGKLSNFLAFWSSLMLIALMVYLIKKRQDTKIAV
jgi:MFS family permease